jgi:microcystin-dependent protein
MAGTISLSLSQQFNARGEPLSGGLLYFYAAGTTTPQLAYQDSALSIAHPWPLVCDSAGRLPQFFLADGSIKIRLTDSAGVVQIAADNILVVGPSSGEGGGGSVDSTTIFDTGDIKARYGTGVHTGWVRANGRTIGSATSGATERANLDTQALFEYLWTADSNLSVSSGRGASANADWVANKTIALPDWRGRAIAGLDDMGASAAGRLTSSYFGATATTLGAAGGAESHTLTEAQLPSLTKETSEFNSSVTVPLFANNVGDLNPSNATQVVTNVAVGSLVNVEANGTTHAHTVSFGSGAAHNNTPPTMLTTIYIKL